MKQMRKNKKYIFLIIKKKNKLTKKIIKKKII